MTTIEHRKHTRFPLASRPLGEFRLRTPAMTYPIEVIKDISSSGIRVYLDFRLAVPLQVAVDYVESGLTLEVNGMVIWCDPLAPATDAGETSGRFVIGIQLLSPVLLMAMSGVI